MFGLDTDTIRNIKDCLAKIPQIQKVLLYGSRAKGNYKNGSDIDLTLIGKNLNPDDSIYPLKKELDKLYLPYTFDISILSKLDKLEFINHILRVGKTFYQKETNELPAGWQQKKLGDVCEIIAGQSPEGKYYNNENQGLAFYQGKKEFTKKFIGKPVKWTTKITKEAIKNDILMSVRAPVGPVNFSTGRICIGRGLAIIRAGKKIDKEFLFNFLVMQENKIIGNTGTVFNSISKSQIEAIQIPIPPLAEQKRIVAVLDKTFTAIDKIKNNTEKNLANTKELWQSYLQQSFNNPKKNWQQKKLGEITTIQLGKTPQRQTEKFWDKIKKTSNIWLKISDLIHGHTIIDSKEYVSDEGAKMISITPKGTLMLSYKLTLGRVSFAGKDLLTNEAIASFLNLDSNMSKIFLYYYFSFFNWDLAIAGDIKLKGKTLNKAKLNALQIPIPPLAEQKQITERLDYLSQKTTALQETYCKKIQNLIELKNSLLKQAFQGEL